MFNSRGRRAERAPAPATKESAASDATREFPPTEWGLVLSAGAESGAALERLCRLYWRPAYSFVRRAGYSREDAHDLIQDFFASSIADGVFSTVRPERGQFRTWLRVALTRFVRNHAERPRRQGERSVTVPLERADIDAVDELVSRDLAPDQEYDRMWALNVLQRALARMEQDQILQNGRERFQQLRPWLIAQPSPRELTEIGRALGMSVNSVSVAVFSARQRLRTYLNEEVSESLERGDDPDALHAEITALIGAVGA